MALQQTITITAERRQSYHRISRHISTAMFMFIIICLGATPSFATRESRPIQIDHRVHQIIYQTDAVFKYTGHYRYASQIEFAHDEEIKTISMGDSTAWLLNPSGFRLFLKPIEQDATTNMTIITNKRTYLFELHARETDDIDDKDMVFITRFVYPAGDDKGQTVSNYLDAVPSPESDPGKYNLKYSISGSDVIAPIRIFDDGQFTYFQFRNKNADIPAFFLTDDKGNEALINYRTRGDYIVVERVAKQFTLRHGKLIVCVFNETWNPVPVLPPEYKDKDQ
jgi:type IV secretion system protein VirB9